MDFMAPLLETGRGNKHLLVVMDHVTKWCELFPTKDEKAHAVALILVSTTFSRFGPPSVLHSDQGRNFERSLWVSTNLGLLPIILNAMAYLKDKIEPCKISYLLMCQTIKMTGICG